MGIANNFVNTSDSRSIAKHVCNGKKSIILCGRTALLFGRFFLLYTIRSSFLIGKIIVNIKYIRVYL